VSAGDPVAVMTDMIIPGVGMAVTGAAIPVVAGLVVSREVAALLGAAAPREGGKHGIFNRG
jgi:hypothetical protein